MRVQKKQRVRHRAIPRLLFGQLQNTSWRRFTAFPLSLCIALLLFFGMSGLRPPAFRSLQSKQQYVVIHIVGTSQPPGFQPVLVTVHIGDALIFRNNAQPPETYTIAAQDHGFLSPPIATGQQWTFVIRTPGTYEYAALGEPPSIVGAIVVVPGAVALLPTPDPGSLATEVASIQDQVRRSSSDASFSLLPFFLITAAVLICLAIGGLLLLRRRYRRSTSSGAEH